MLAVPFLLYGTVIGCSCSQYAGRKYDSCNGCGPGSWAPPGCGGLYACGCGDQCVGACDGSCDSGCSDGCGAQCGCGAGQGLFRGQILNALCGCSGCDSELYWSEWHNDPPCCEPCDCCGNYTGKNCCTSGCCTSPTCTGGCDVAYADAFPTETYSANSAKMVLAGYANEELASATEADSAYDASFDAYQAEFDDSEDLPLQ